MRIFSLFFIFAIFLFGCGVKGNPKPPNQARKVLFLNVNIKQQGDLIVFYWKTSKYISPSNFKIYINNESLELPIYHIKNFYWVDFKYPENNRKYCFYTSTFSHKEEMFSNIKCIEPKNYTKINDKLKLKLKNNGILLKWSNKYEKVNIYKGSSYIEIKPIPYYQVENQNEFLDTSVILNKIYCYYITVTINNIESNRVYSKCLKFEDIYPPSPPNNLTYIIKDKNLILIWEPPDDTDLKGFIIYKNDKLYTDYLINSYYFIDNKYKKGDIYKIYSIDKVGNKSKPVYLKVE